MEPDDDKTQTHVVLTKGTMVSHYRIIEKIGSGGMGEVYLALDTKLNRKVALKFLPPHLCQDEDCRKRFKREAQAAAKLSHPNIVTIFEVGEFQGRPFFAMEHVEGRSLRDVKSEELDVDRIIGIAIQLCDGLQTAHAAGVIHRDIKPSNIVIDSSGRPKLLDFGLAIVKGGEQLTKTGSTLGTVGYMSPEQIEGKATDTRSDLFSLGVVLYELIANKSPFRRDDETATLKAILQDAPQPLARYNSNVTDDLQRIITKLLEKDPALRYQSASGVIPDLKKLSAVSSASMATERKRDRWNRYVVPSAVIILLAVVAIWYFGYHDRTPSSSAKDDKIMLAVLPFENLGDPEDELFSDGIADEVSARLAAVRMLGVIGRISVRQYKNTAKTVQEIGSELGVDYLLVGTVRWQRKSGAKDRVRVIPELIRISDATSVWTEIFDAEAKAVFEVQAMVASQVAASLDIALGLSEREALGAVPTGSLEAYDYYLRARAYYETWSDDSDIERAISLYQRAVELDSTFVRAWADLSFAASFLFWSGHGPDRADLARLAAEKSVLFDTMDTYSHLAVGYYAYYCERDFQKALREFEKLSNRLPSDANSKAAMGYVLRRLGRWEESLEYQQQAITLEPNVGYYYDGIIQTARYMRKWGDAYRWAEAGLTLFADMILVQQEIILLEVAESGDPERALAAISMVPQSIRKNEAVSLLEMDLLYWKGDYQFALKVADGLLANIKTSGDSATYFYQVGRTYERLEQFEVSRHYYDSAAAVISDALEMSSPYRHGGPLALPVGRVMTKVVDADSAIIAARSFTDMVPVTVDACKGADVLMELAYAYTLTGRFDSAFAIVDSLLTIPSPLTVPLLKIDPDFAPLRDNPRFRALIEKYEKEHGT